MRHILQRGVPYQERGELYFQQRDREQTDRYRRRFVPRPELLGRKVTLEPPPEAT